MGSCSCMRVLVTLVVVLSVTVALLVAILVWRETSRGDKTDGRGDRTSHVISEFKVNQTYPTFFRTPQENSRYVQSYLYGFENRVIVNTTISSGEVCSFKCNSSLPETPFFRRKRATAVYHGCCVSNVQFTTPSSKTNVLNQSKTLLQLKNLKQYFPEHTCQSVSGCTGCVCAQESSFHTAVVLKPGVSVAEEIDDTTIDFFYFPGCCKCINN